jgi:anti-sigma B factor antagonist
MVVVPSSSAVGEDQMLSRTETLHGSQPTSRAFGIWQRELDEHTRAIVVEGELDLSAAPRLKWMLVDSLESGASRIAIDLSLATFMDSTALGVLVGIRRKLDAGQRLAIVCPSIDILKIFEFAGMEAAFAIFPTLEEALADLGGHAGQPG